MTADIVEGLSIGQFRFSFQSFARGCLYYRCRHVSHIWVKRKERSIRLVLRFLQVKHGYNCALFQGSTNVSSRDMYRVARDAKLPSFRTSIVPSRVVCKRGVAVDTHPRCLCIHDTCRFKYETAVGGWVFQNRPTPRYAGGARCGSYQARPP